MHWSQTYTKGSHHKKNRILSLFKILFQSYKEKEPKSAQKNWQNEKGKRKRRGLKWSPHQRGAVAGDQDYDILQYKVREIPMKIALGQKSVD